MTSRRHLSPSAAAPLEDENLLPEILLRLPPQPSSLPRVSLVCKRWRSLVSDPGFLRRFRIHHRRSPPLLGCFVEEEPHGISFLPALEAPNRVPPVRLSLVSAHKNRVRLLNCRHGLVLVSDKTRHHQFLVWDTFTGDQYHLATPALFATEEVVLINGAVLRAVGDTDTHHFQVVCVATRRLDVERRQAALACVYSSETGTWGNLISTPIPPDLDSESRLDLYLFGITIASVPAMLLGDSLYWTLNDDLSSILEFDLQRQSLAVIRMPTDVYKGHIRVIREDSGGLGFLMVTDFTVQLWKRKINCNGVASWWPGRTIELDNLLSLNPEKGGVVVLGLAEENNMVFLQTFIGLFALQLQSLQFQKLSETKSKSHCHPFESVYIAGT